MFILSSAKSGLFEKIEKEVIQKATMIASKAFWTRFSVDKQEFLLKLVILTIAAILGTFSVQTIKPA